MLFQFSLWFCTQSLGKAGVTLEHDSTLQGMSKEEMLERVQRKDPELLNKVWAFSRSMRDTPAYWHEFYKRVLACCEQWPPHCYTFWVTQSIADTRIAYVHDRLPGQVSGLTQFARTKAHPVHAAWLWDHFRNCFLDVYVSGFLKCDNYIARDEEQGRKVWHLHCLGSRADWPQGFRELLRQLEELLHPQILLPKLIFF